jgi:outer membrane protein assembly factor BamD (BamD/ComL family)
VRNFIIVASFASLALSGCADKDWSEAVAAGNAAAYSNYARTHPGTGRANAAQKRAEELALQEAMAARTSTAFEAFRAAYPNSPHAAEAAAQAETLGWEEAARDGAAGYTLFLARYPRSPRAPEAEARIEELVWTDATSANTEEAFGRYLLRYPNGPHAADARQRRTDLAWQATTTADTVDAYERFLKKYGGGGHTDEARAWLDATKVSRLHPVVVLLESWQDDRLRSTILARYRSAFDAQVLAGLGTEFGMDAISLVDAKKVPWTHPHELFGAAADTGVLVLEVTEKRGAAFEPSGHATRVVARLSFYAPNTRTPVIVRTFEAATPQKVKGIDESSLHTGAVQAVAEQVRVAEPEIVRQKRPE